MKLILIIAYVIALILGKWCGKPFQWTLRFCASNPYAAILLCGIIFLGIIRIINYLAGETALYGVRNPFRGVRHKTTHSKRKE